MLQFLIPPITFFDRSLKNYPRFHLPALRIRRWNKSTHANCHLKNIFPAKNWCCKFLLSACKYSQRACQILTSCFLLFKYFNNSFEAILPEISDGGTPGPGTVSCPA